ncbi:methyl-accepting chemotaxis protein [Ideonella sp. B508-1]|uniref:methyl-accepting chemotaxis protein n=1 Tax=Ideonella sp. B508-1 TaxID=137716 RepID=UPI00034D5C5D|nr:methyl-accepting chemotaxis protein [Ideonella sp. B508-1]
MDFWNNARIGTRLAVGFALLMLAVAAVALYGCWALQGVGGEIRALVDVRVRQVGQARDIKDHLNIVARGVRNVVLLSDPAQVQSEVRRIRDSESKSAELLEALRTSPLGDEGQALLGAVVQAREAYRPRLEEALSLAQADQDDEARDALLKRVRPVQSAYLQALDRFVAQQVSLMEEAAQGSMQTVQRATQWMAAVAALAVLLGGVVAWAVTLSVTRPLQAAVAVTARVAQGDLATEVPMVQRRDELGHLLQGLAHMQQGLRQLVGGVRGNADSVATASTQIAQGNQDLSRRTEQQAGALQETAATMEELNTTVQQNAQSARQASQLAQDAARVASEGDEVVHRMGQTMEDITASSRRIADITGVIDGIAFQTNILALNAAVESARAGEQGRGFAVVAAEVRTLAQRSAQAAREIKSLITESVERVELGGREVDRVRQTMAQLLGSIGQVNTVMGEISAATEEQARGVALVGEAVGQMDLSTQQNAALVEESAAAAESLRQQAGQLVEAVAFFRVRSPGATAPV